MKQGGGDVKELTDQEKLYADTYLSNGFNKADAYRVAYPTATERSVASNGYKVATKPHVKEYIAERFEEIFGDTGEAAAKVLTKLAEIAFAERGDDYYTSTAQLKALELIQKQYGFQTQNIKADVKTTLDIVINIEGDDDGTGT